MHSSLFHQQQVFAWRAVPAAPAHSIQSMEDAVVMCRLVALNPLHDDAAAAAGSGAGHVFVC
jgi:hypothetical protein